MKKTRLGQFYTTNYKYILQGFTISDKEKIIIEPFVGKGDLLKLDYVKSKNVEYYDIDPKYPNTKKRDTLLNPPSYKDKFVITNPPYLARNKSDDKTLFDKYKINDLYKCFVKQIIFDPPNGGIVIIPLNFWCSIRKGDIELRKEFLAIFAIDKLNIFEEKVFNDTTYTVCSFQFHKRLKNSNKEIKAIIYPCKINIKFKLNEKNNYIIGGEIYTLSQNKDIVVDRLTHKNKDDNKKYITNLLLKCIDDSETNKISLTLVKDDEIYIDDTQKCSARSYASIIIKPALSLEKQKKLAEHFNIYMTFKRKYYHSLFLTNYRESKTIARKRISFGLAYKIINNLISKLYL